MSTPSHCPYCGAPVPPEARYCGQCGVPLVQAPMQSQPKRRRLPSRVAVWLFVLVLVACFGVGAVGGYRYKTGYWPLQTASSTAGAAAGNAGSSASGPVTSDADVTELLGAVVSISVQSSLGNRAGSGFIVDDQGRVVTAAHVVEGASCVTVMDSNGRLHPGTVVAVQSSKDLAYVQVPGLTGWTDTLSFGDSQRLPLYDDVYVLGFPKGLGNSVALRAQVSRLHDQRNIDGRYYGNLIQISGARVLEGTSGGPLIDRRTGQVVGVITAGTDGDLAYAVPSEELAASLQEWKELVPNSLCEPVPAAQTTSVLLAAVVPLSGADSIDGSDLLDGVTLAVRDYEENLRAVGYDVLVQPFDDRSQPAAAREMAVQAAANAKVVGVVGSLQSEVTRELAEALAPEQLPMVAPVTGVEASAAQQWPHANWLVADPGRLPQATASFAKEHLKLERIYLLKDESAADDLQEATMFQWAAGVLDLPVVGEASLAADQSYTKLVQAIRESGADGLYLAASGGRAVEVVRRLRLGGLAVPILGGPGLYAPGFQGLTDSEFREVFFPSLTAESSEPFQRHFESMMGRPTRGYAAYGYDAASVILQALIRYGEEHPAQVPSRAELAALVRETAGYSGRTSWISFDSETGENATSWVYIYEWQQGIPVLRESLQ